ncbi:MAG: DUF72 domain-containing protein [Verrucomicrobiae bacterium]|nr:DUF72 domain-containing protein [Verrucomicrobiae bacterium]
MESQPQYLIGTCAWSFDAWKGVFYPAKLKPTDYLPWYARFFNTVEIDSTFYNIPPPHYVRAWVRKTPDHFIFSCKLPKMISHEARLKDCQAEVTSFLSVMENFGGKLGRILLQLPPSFSTRDEHALKKFILAWPREFPLAVEFRHPSWRLPRLEHFLQEHGVVHAWNDLTGPDSKDFAAFLPTPVTSPDLYVRLLGDITKKYRRDGSTIHTYGRILWPRASAIEQWASKFRIMAPTVRRVFCYFNNHYEGFSIQSCITLLKGLGQPAPDFQKALHEGEQMELDQ